MTKLFVANLDFSITEADLLDCFAQIGAVTDAHISRDGAGESKGFGFVTFATDEEALMAIRCFGGQSWRGRRMVVQISKPKTLDDK